MELISLAYPVPYSRTTSITHTRVAHIRLTLKKTSLRKKDKKDPVVYPDLFVAFDLRSCLPLVSSLLQTDLLVVLWHALFLDFVK